MAHANIDKTQRRRTAALVKQYRERHRLSQREFGELCGLDQAVVSRIESQGQGLSVAGLVRIAGVLEVSITDLAGVSR